MTGLVPNGHLYSFQLQVLHRQTVLDSSNGFYAAAVFDMEYGNTRRSTSYINVPTSLLGFLGPFPSLANSFKSGRPISTSHPVLCNRSAFLQGKKQLQAQISLRSINNVSASLTHFPGLKKCGITFVRLFSLFVRRLSKAFVISSSSNQAQLSPLFPLKRRERERKKETLTGKPRVNIG